MRDGTLEDTLTQEKKDFEEYIAKLTEEADEPLVNPVKYDDSEFFTCLLSGGVNRVTFSTADSPFFKTATAKYYPEAVLISADGTILSRVNPTSKRATQYGMSYLDDFRDPVLKINDDRKISIQLHTIQEEGAMILLLVKEFDLSGKKVSE